MSLYQSSLVEDGSLIKVHECIISGYEIGQQTEAKLKEIQQNAHLKGFRKGKTPMNVIQETYFGQTFYEIINKQANACIAEIAEKNNYKLATSPNIDIDSESSLPADRSTANIKDVSMKVTYELLPNVPEIDFSKVDIAKYSLDVKDEDIANELQRLAKSRSSKEEKDGPIENSDITVIDFIGYQDGIEFEGGKSENHELEIGSKSLINGFEAGLVGLTKGEEKTLSLVFPEEYHAKDLAGKPVEFKVTIKKVLKQIPAELDDEFAKQLGFETLDALKTDIKQSLIDNYVGSYKNTQKNIIFEKIKVLLDFEVPPSMVPVEKETQSEGEDVKPQTLEDIRLSIFLMNHASDKKIEVSQQDFMMYIESMASMYGQNPKMIFDIYQKNEQMKASVQNLLFENKIYDSIFEAIPSKEQVKSKEEFEVIIKAEKEKSEQNTQK
ncbi:MAG: trigger factor [Candidatus Deianiraeaceae bacterium]|jgi:trigger factor